MQPSPEPCFNSSRMCSAKSRRVANASSCTAQVIIWSHSPFLVLSPLSSLEVAEDQKKRNHTLANCAVNCAMIHTWLGHNRSADCPITFGLWINEGVISTQFTVYGCKCSQIKAGLPYRRCTFSNQVHHSPNTAVEYPKHAHSSSLSLYM